MGNRIPPSSSLLTQKGAMQEATHLGLGFFVGRVQLRYRNLSSSEWDMNELIKWNSFVFLLFLFSSGFEKCNTAQHEIEKISDSLPI